MFDDHERCVGYVHADLDYRCRHQSVQFATLETLHRVFLLVGIHATVEQANAKIGEYLLPKFVVHLDCRLKLHILLTLLDHWIHDVRLLPSLHLFAEEFPYLRRSLIADAAGHDRRASWRKFIENADIEIAVEGERQRARNGRCGHDERVGSY